MHPTQIQTIAIPCCHQGHACPDFSKVPNPHPLASRTISIKEKKKKSETPAQKIFSK